MENFFKRDRKATIVLTGQTRILVTLLDHCVYRSNVETGFYVISNTLAVKTDGVHRVVLLYFGFRKRPSLKT